jgi:hypothetical protein
VREKEGGAGVCRRQRAVSGARQGRLREEERRRREKEKEGKERKEKGEGKERQENGKKEKGGIKKREGKIGEGILEKSGKLLGKIGKGFAGVFPVSGYQRVFRASAYFLGRR